MQQLKNRTLFFGDNLRILERIPDESFDLIYIDLPFNYNVLFKEGKVDSAAQIHAFEDTWEWTPQTIQLFDDLQNHRNPSRLFRKPTSVPVLYKEALAIYLQ